MQKTRVQWGLSVHWLNVRIAFLAIALVHLVVTAVVTLSIDTTVDEDVKIQDYYYTRWKLLTCWFNLMTLAYLPGRLYVDWKTRKGEGNQRAVKTLHHATDVLMTGVLMPTTVFADLMFWSIYLTEPDLIAPASLFNYLPYWSQHSLHSISLAVVIMDLLLTPRRRPSSMKARLTLLSTFVLLYTVVIYFSLWRGEIVYAFLERMTIFELAQTFVFALSMHLIFFYIQWFLIDLLWKSKVHVQYLRVNE